MKKIFLDNCNSADIPNGGNTIKAPSLSVDIDLGHKAAGNDRGGVDGASNKAVGGTNRRMYIFYA